MAKFKKDIVIESDLSQDPTDRDELYVYAQRYGVADAAEKSAKATKDLVKGPMLDLMTRIVREEIPLARETVVITDEEAATFDHDWKKWCEQERPEWKIISLMPEAGQTTVVIEEREELKKFEFEFDGKKYGRTLAMVGAEFLAESFYAEVFNDTEGVLIEDDDAALAALNSIKLTTVYTLDEEAAQAAIADYPELMPLFQRYSTIGKPQVRLIPIKAIKEDV